LSFGAKNQKWTRLWRTLLPSYKVPCRKLLKKILNTIPFKIFIYNRITGKPQNLKRDIFRWETLFSVRTKAFENLDQALQHISISQNWPRTPARPPTVGHHYVLGLKTDFLKLFLLNDFLEDKILPNSTLFIWGFYLELIKSYER